MMITILIVLFYNGILPVYSNKQLEPHSQSMKWGVWDLNFNKGQKSLASTTIDDNPNTGVVERQLMRVTEDYNSATRTHRQVQHRRRPRSAVQDRSKLWRNGIVPYVLSSRYNRTEKGKILSAFHDFHEKTYVRFVPQTTQQDYLSLEHLDGCYTDGIGRRGGQQTVSIGDGCFRHGTLLHELMQALGFFHEHTRPDRDDYVRIEWHNIIPIMQYLFQKKNFSAIKTMVPYDYGSVMHNDAYAFSRNGNPTIVPLQPGVKIGQRRGFSEGDVKRINLLYEPYTIFDPFPSATTANTPPMYTGRQWTPPPSATTEISPPMQNDRQWACGWESSHGNPSPLWTCKWVRTQNYTPEEIPYKII